MSHSTTSGGVRRCRRRHASGDSGPSAPVARRSVARRSIRWPRRAGTVRRVGNQLDSSGRGLAENLGEFVTAVAADDNVLTASVQLTDP